jgi:hypothetical protein
MVCIVYQLSLKLENSTKKFVKYIKNSKILTKKKFTNITKKLEHSTKKVYQYN